LTASTPSSRWTPRSRSDSSNPERLLKIIGSTAAWKNDLDHALARLRELGFDEVDLIVIESWGLVSLDGLVNDFEREASRVEGLLAKHGLRAVSVNAAFTPDLHNRADAAGNTARLAEVRAVARLMSRLGIQIGAHYPGHLADWKNDADGVWRDTMASLREIQSVTADFPGLRLAPELHYQTPFESPAAARRLLREFPGLPYTYEPSHFIVQGIDWRETGDLLDGAAHVHLRGCAPGRLQAPPAEAEEALRWVLTRLKARNFRGMISIEYLPEADFPVEQAIAELRAEIHRWIEGPVPTRKRFSPLRNVEPAS
jgi:sugar phosphate isomerase/epimerase